MKSILAALYAGELFPMEQNTPKTEEYRKIHQKQYQHYIDFIEILKKQNPPLDTKFAEIMNEQSEATPYELAAAFANGFRLGAKLMIEIFQDD